MGSWEPLGLFLACNDMLCNCLIKKNVDRLERWVEKCKRKKICPGKDSNQRL